MPIYTVTFKQRYQIAHDTWLFEFDQPENFDYIPGQYAGFTFSALTNADNKGSNRRFSLLPGFNANTIAFCTRIMPACSAYKQQLMQLKTGDTLKLAGPIGQFLLPENLTQPLIMIAGGVGIAPFYSMLNNLASAAEKLSNITLFYGNLTPAHIAFKHEIQTFSEAGLHCVFTVDQPDPDWRGEIGFVDTHLMQKYMTPFQEARFYVCGSKAMVAHVQNQLLTAGTPAEHVIVEDFPGY